MKSKLTLSLMLSAGLFFTACNTNNNSGGNNENEAALSANISSATVEWVAFKTTAKAPVKGAFTNFEFTGLNEGGNIDEVLNNATININALDIFTNDTARDATIRQNFFEKMMEAGKISGKLVKTENQWMLNLKMNGVPVDNIPAEVSYENDTARLHATIDLNDFKALSALEALSTACFDLHKGADGVSKTWEVVEVNASIEVK